MAGAFAAVLAAVALSGSPASASADPPGAGAQGSPQLQAQRLREAVDAQLRLTPGGTRTAADEVSWHGGKVVMTWRPPADGGVVPLVTCRSEGWCFHEHSDFNEGSSSGRTLWFQDCNWQDLADWGFSDKTSSWQNRSGNTIKVINHASGKTGHGSDGTLFRMSPKSSARSIGSNNDKADHFECV
ncbi:hypothetical protein ACFFSW_27015 [Saccharothrix longispora]|uniref:Peptidase inhibitor family I36 n=1 Tax=Saccharothrix longispora TaxID=33920 RepID=A0ABU1Q134_9PSEU|nr:hypothetical protein [Saccharothrix longispora]MDR6596376.1 hypothetical protein [Saccharothrix longispora]